MACFDTSSSSVKEMLFKIYRARKPMEMDERIFEFGAVEYHIKSSVSDPFVTYLSVATPAVVCNQELPNPEQILKDKFKMMRRLHRDAVEITQPAKQGYQVTLKLDFSKIKNLKDPTKIISEISTVQAVILSSKLREILQKLVVSDDYAKQGMFKAIKLAYHPRETLFVVRQPAKITVVFPMSFKEDSDVIIANAFIQELIDVSSSKAWEKAPLCSWSPIPPPELTGETFADLNTNCGFISIDLLSSHVKVKKLDNVVWGLLNFYAFVKFHLKCMQGFIHRRMRKRLKGLIEAFENASPDKEFDDDDETPGCRCINRSIPTFKCRNIAIKLKRMRYSIRRRRKKISKFSSSPKYTKLE